MSFEQFLALDLPPLMAAIFSAVACALLGNYLVLRRLSLMGDAISHAVLPGIVIAFLLTSSRSSLPVFLGAAIAGILSAMLIEAVTRYGRVESGAAMGVVFSLFFALGVLLIEQAAARSVDLDADCLLHGQLESIFWHPPTDMRDFFSWRTLQALPDEVASSFFTMVAVGIFVVVLFKELKISTFDPALSSALGFSNKLLYNLLMVFVACAVVASFRVVGSILVIAMLVCPAASARLLTDKLSEQLIISGLLAIIASVLGYLAGAFGPGLLGFSHSVNAAGMITVVLGVILFLSITLAPSHGWLARSIRQRRLAVAVRREDILALLFRFEEASRGTEERSREEAGAGRSIGIKLVAPLRRVEAFFDSPALTRRALSHLQQQGAIVSLDGELALTAEGEAAAREVVRSHRLWESYLVSELGIKPDHVHEAAEELEHFTGPELQEELAQAQGAPAKDPHGSDIP